MCWQHFFFARNTDCAVGAYVKFEETEADLNKSACEIMFRRILDSQRSNHLAVGNGANSITISVLPTDSISRARTL